MIPLGNLDVERAAMGQFLSRRMFVVGTVGILVSATLSGCAGSAADRSEWSWAQDDDLPVLCMEVSGGAVVAMPGNGWKSQDGWIQLQLSGGSIPGKEIEAIRQEGTTLVVVLKKPESDIETMDMLLTEYRLTGGDAVNVESVVVEDRGERNEAQRDETEA